MHALKSSSRQIGAPELGDMAADLEKAGKEKDLDTIFQNTGKLLRTYEALLETLSQYFHEEEVDESSLPAITGEALSAMLDRLVACCDDLDMDGMEAVKDEMKKYSYSEEANEAVHKLYDAIDNMDIDGCMELIDQLRAGA